MDTTILKAWREVVVTALDPRNPIRWQFAGLLNREIVKFGISVNVYPNLITRIDVVHEWGQEKYLFSLRELAFDHRFAMSIFGSVPITMVIGDSVEQIPAYQVFLTNRLSRFAFEHDIVMYYYNYLINAGTLIPEVITDFGVV